MRTAMRVLGWMWAAVGLLTFVWFVAEMFADLPARRPDPLLELIGAFTLARFFWRAADELVITVQRESEPA